MHVFTIHLYVSVLTQMSGDTYEVCPGAGICHLIALIPFDLTAMDTCIFLPFPTEASCQSLGPRD